MSHSSQRISIEERARRYLASMEAPRRDPSDPQDSHTVVFNATRALLHGFGFTPAEALPLLEQYCARSDMPWTQGEIYHKLRSVEATPCKWSRGYLRNEGDWKPSAQQRKDLGIPTEAEVRQKVEFQLDELKRIAAPYTGAVNALWLGDRSAHDPATLSSADFLKLLYPAGEKILIFKNEFGQGDALWPDDGVPNMGKVGVWFLPQPVSGQYLPNPEGKPNPDGTVKLSRRQWRCVQNFRYFVMESDTAPVAEWLGFIVQIPARIEALYTSGARSVHALIRVDCPTKEAWDQEKQRMMPFLMAGLMCGADRGTWSAVRLSRLPGCVRFGKMVPTFDAEGKPIMKNGKQQKTYQRYEKAGIQKLLYFRPNAPLRPICDIPPERDTLNTWLKLSAGGIADSDDTGGAWLFKALDHYGPCNSELRAARKRLESEAAQ